MIEAILSIWRIGRAAKWKWRIGMRGPTTAWIISGHHEERDTKEDAKLSAEAFACTMGISIIEHTRVLDHYDFSRTELIKLIQLNQRAEENFVKNGTSESPLIDQPLYNFDLSVRSYNACKKLEVNSLRKLAKKTEGDILAVRCTGQTCLNEMKALLAKHGLQFSKKMGFAGGPRLMNISGIEPSVIRVYSADLKCTCKTSDLFAFGCKCGGS